VKSDFKIQKKGQNSYYITISIINIIKLEINLKNIDINSIKKNVRLK